MASPPLEPDPFSPKEGSLGAIWYSCVKAVDPSPDGGPPIPAAMSNLASGQSALVTLRFPFKAVPSTAASAALTVDGAYAVTSFTERQRVVELSAV